MTRGVEEKKKKKGRFNKITRKANLEKEGT